MGNKKNAVSLELNRIKEKHGLTNEGWARLSGVPKGTVNRYLSYNVGVPSYAYVCAMLSCVGESSEDFYAAIAAESPVELAGLAAPAEAKPSPQPDPALLPGMQERINEQAERLQELQERAHEQDAQLRVLRAENAALQDKLAERDRSIARRDEVIREKNRSNRALVIAVAVLVLIVVYFLWEIVNIDKGITALLYPGLK